MIKMEQSSQEVDSSTRSAGWRSSAAPGVESRNECCCSSGFYSSGGDLTARLAGSEFIICFYS